MSFTDTRIFSPAFPWLLMWLESIWKFLFIAITLYCFNSPLIKDYYIYSANPGFQHSIFKTILEYINRNRSSSSKLKCSRLNSWFYHLLNTLRNIMNILSEAQSRTCVSPLSTPSHFIPDGKLYLSSSFQFCFLLFILISGLYRFFVLKIEKPYERSLCFQC